MPFDPSVGGEVYSGTGGTLILEAENTDLQGDWSRVTVDGEQSILWDSDKSNYGQVDPAETVKFTFMVDESGVYSVGMHSGRIKSVMNDSDRYENGSSGAERTDTGNDAYVGLVDAVTGEVIKTPTKLYTGLGSADQDLKWGTKFDDSSGHYDAELTLEAGRIYELEITGRSDGYVLDRITLNKGGFLRDADASASALETIPPDAPAPPDSPTEPDEPTGDEVPPQMSGSYDSGGGFLDDIFSIFEGIFDAIAGLFGGGDDDETDVASAEVSASVNVNIAYLNDLVPDVAVEDLGSTDEIDELQEPVALVI